MGRGQIVDMKPYIDRESVGQERFVLEFVLAAVERRVSLRAPMKMMMMMMMMQALTDGRALGAASDLARTLPI